MPTTTKPLIKRRPLPHPTSLQLPLPRPSDPTVCDCLTCTPIGPPQTPLTRAISALEIELSQMRHLLHKTPTHKPRSSSPKPLNTNRSTSTIRRPLSPNALINSYAHDLASPISHSPTPPTTTTTQHNFQQQEQQQYHHHHCPPWPPRSSSLPPHLRNPPQSHPPNLPSSQTPTLPTLPSSTHPPRGVGITFPHPRTVSELNTHTTHEPLQTALPLNYDPSETDIIDQYAATGFRGRLTSRLGGGPRREVNISGSGEGIGGFREGPRREIRIISAGEGEREEMRGVLGELDLRVGGE
ncbi:MAG: hypothetical protein M1835_007009 [Candelina submexicana]|nr:MAG: hypothetical protein M1835_007009 [Candelina submexicana]